MVGRGETAVVHDQDILFGETRLEAELGVARGLAVGVRLPFRVVSTGIVYRDAATGEAVPLVSPNIHHRDETLAGIGDPWVTARAGGVVAGVELGAQLGVSLPLGRTEEDPFRLGDMGLPHEHIQMGTGTMGVVIGAEVAKRLGARWRLSAWGLAQLAFFENDKGYHAGQRVGGGVAARLRLGRWTVGGGVDAQVETAERWHGMEPVDDGNRGRLDLLVGGDAAVALGERIALAVSAKVPVVTEVVGGQLDYPVVVGVSVTARLGRGAAPGAEEHHHVHVAPASPPGEVGVVTVVDYWAEWCVPCKELDRRLQEVVARHPGRVVVRRVDVTHREELTFHLPYVQLIGPDGTLRWERNASPEELAGAVEAELE